METATQICSVELISKLNGIKQLEIEAILGRRVRKGSTEYMIKWKGHSRFVNNIHSEVVLLQLINILSFLFYF